MLTHQRTIAASVTKLVIFYRIAVGKFFFIHFHHIRKATDHCQPQESNSGDADFTCMSIRKPNSNDISLPVDD